MSRLQVFLLRWIASTAICNNGAHRMFEVIAREAAEVWHEDNWTSVESWARERMSVGFHNARVLAGSPQERRE